MHEAVETALADYSARPKPKRATMRRIGLALDAATPTWLLLTVWGGVLAAGLVITALKVDLQAQFCLSYSVLGAMIVLRKISRLGRTRLFFLVCSAFLTLRYLIWRTTSTLGYNGFADFLFMLLLYGAELYGIVMALLGLFVNCRPVQRAPAPLIGPRGRYPSVDLFVPTYDEPTELLEITLRAAVDIRYPREKLNIYLLDDGGTTQKRSQADPLKAAQARSRAHALRALAIRHGAIYLARERNEHAKAGNINAALQRTSGDLVVIFDADHVPTADFLEKTVGYFQRDPALFLVQTPHFFINPDPLEKNLGLFGKMPAENEMFYSVVQRGLDFWNAAFFCGSAAVLKRRCLEEIGGIAGTSITEDAETALMLHARGYRSVYVSEALVSGLQPETFASFIVQRVRWAQGMVQILLLRNPLRMKGLTFPQRLCYFSSAFFWLFCFARLVFIVAPVMYLVFGLQVYNASIPEFFAYGLPSMVAALLSTDFLFGRYRWTLVSEVYELLQSMFSIRAICSVLLHPHAPSFKVTPKGERIDKDTISALAGPFYVVYAVALLGAAVGVWKLVYGYGHRDVIIAALVWSGLNLVLLNACLGVLYERKQRRAVPRVPANMEGKLHLPPSQAQGASARVVACRVIDLSARGVKLSFALTGDTHAPHVRLSGAATLEIFSAALGRVSHIPLHVCNAVEARGIMTVGAQFVNESAGTLSEQVALVFGDSGRWQAFRASRNRRVGIVHSLGIIATLGTVQALRHYCVFFRRAFRCAASSSRFASVITQPLRFIGHTKS